MKRHFTFLLAVVALFVGMEAAAQQLEKPQATLIYSIVRLVDWPELYKDQTFVIGVVGDKMDITRELRAGKGDRTVSGKEIEIVEYASIKEVGKCHLLFVPNEHLNSFTKSGTNLSGQPILVKTESSYRNPTREYTFRLSLLGQPFFVKNIDVIYHGGNLLNPDISPATDYKLPMNALNTYH